MDYSNFLMMKEELSLIAVIVVLLLYDLCASKKALRYFQPVACVLVGVHTLLNLPALRAKRSAACTSTRR